MAAVTSQMLPLGTNLPAFSLIDTKSGKLVSSDSLRGKVSVVAFICNHCPYVVHIKSALAAFGEEYEKKGVAMVCISSNDSTSYPQDGPEKMAADAIKHRYPFPYLFDESQEVAKSFAAACTPDFYVFSKEGTLAYRGQFDASRPGNGQPITGRDLRGAVESLLDGGRPDENQTPSMGCNIKWRQF